MKTRKQIVEEVEDGRIYNKYALNVKDIYSDIGLLMEYAAKKEYYFSIWDALAIGYMCGQSNLQTIFDEKKLKAAIKKYDKEDKMKRLDTVAEVFIDLLDLKL